MIITAHPYDEVAPSYDRLWASPTAHAEDEEIIQRIRYQGGSVLDIGCGTGLFLDHHPDCQSYLGVDPSEAMLLQLDDKHPLALTTCQTFEQLLPSLLRRGKQFDCIVSLFGTASYITPDALAAARDILSPSGRLFLMFYAPGYTPVTHQYISNPPAILEHVPALYGSVSIFGNYVIAES